MTGLDTNVLLAWVLKGQARNIQGHAPYRISLVVLAELVWTLRTTFKRSREEISQVISWMLGVSEFHFENRDVISMSLADFNSGKADYTDYLLLRDNQANGCSITLTKDRKAARHPHFKLLY